MKGKNGEKGKPRLARASEPFTPLTHKATAAGTPYHPLRVDDLATPKVNKSHSSSDHTEVDISLGLEEVDTTDPIAELRQALTSALSVIERIEKSRKPVQYRTVSTQTTKTEHREKENKGPREPKLRPVVPTDRNRFPLISGSGLCSSSSDSRDKALDPMANRKVDRMAAIRNRFEAKLDILESHGTPK